MLHHDSTHAILLAVAQSSKAHMDNHHRAWCCHLSPARAFAGQDDIAVVSRGSAHQHCLWGDMCHSDSQE